MAVLTVLISSSNSCGRGAVGVSGVSVYLSIVTFCVDLLLNDAFFAFIR